MPIYVYKHPVTGEEFEVRRTFSQMDEPYLSPDGYACPRIQVFTASKAINKNREVFQVDPDYVKKCNPKYVRFRDGHRERYDPTKHT